MIRRRVRRRRVCPDRCALVFPVFDILQILMLLGRGRGEQSGSRCRWRACRLLGERRDRNNAGTCPQRVFATTTPTVPMPMHSMRRCEPGSDPGGAAHPFGGRGLGYGGPSILQFRDGGTRRSQQSLHSFSIGRTSPLRRGPVAPKTQRWVVRRPTLLWHVGKRKCNVKPQTLPRRALPTFGMRNARCWKRSRMLRPTASAWRGSINERCAPGRSANGRIARRRRCITRRVHSLARRTTCPDRYVGRTSVAVQGRGACGYQV